MSHPVHRFRMAMAQFLGRTITPEVAAQIEAQAFHEPDRGVDPARFAAVTHGDYRIQVESFRQILPQLAQLHAEHWLETEKHRHGRQFRPDYETLAARERLGHLVQFTVRRDGELAGQLLMCIGKCIYTQDVIADEVTLFMRQQHRGGFTVMALLRYAEAVLGELGAIEISASSKVLNHADVLMRRLRYEEVAIQFVKQIKEADHVRQLA